MTVPAQDELIKAFITTVSGVAGLTNRVYDTLSPEIGTIGAKTFPYAVVTNIGETINGNNSTWLGPYPQMLLQIDLYCDVSLGITSARLKNDAIFNVLDRQYIDTNKGFVRCNTIGTQFQDSYRILIISQYMIQVTTN